MGQSTETERLNGRVKLGGEQWWTANAGKKGTIAGLDHQLREEYGEIDQVEVGKKGGRRRVRMSVGGQRVRAGRKVVHVAGMAVLLYPAVVDVGRDGKGPVRMVRASWRKRKGGE